MRAPARTRSARILLVAVLASASCGDDADESGDVERVEETVNPRARARPMLGTAVQVSALTKDSAYRELLGSQYASVTPENEMKWNVIHPSRGRFDFEPADAIVEFARRNDQEVHGHTLAWGNQNPTWLTDSSFTRDELIGILREHIDEVVSHYRGDVAVWDVVNEAVADDGGLRPNVWLDGIGPEYIDMAFEFARAADPDAALYYNDTGGEVPGTKADGIFRLVAGLVERDTPIDGVGLQMHTTITTAPPGPVPLGAMFYRPSAGGLARTFARYDALGLDVAVTEMDVRLREPVLGVALDTQADVYRDVFDACRRASNCPSLTTWGFTDRYSWIPYWMPGTGAALPYDEELRPKPAAAVFTDPTG